MEKLVLGAPLVVKLSNLKCKGPLVNNLSKMFQHYGAPPGSKSEQLGMVAPLVTNFGKMF